MGLIKSIFGEINHFIIDFICRCLINSICNTAWNSLCFISVNKVLALLFHDRGLLFGHCTAHQVASAQSITCQVTNDLHNLFLINDTSIGWLKNLFHLFTFIMYAFLMILSLNVSWNKVHWSRSIQRNSSNDIFHILWF